MTENLKRCPFCGGKVRLESSHGFNYVLCKKCKSEYYPASFGDLKKAVAAWNNRPIEDEKDKENKRLREALEFYAHGKHLWDADERDPACDSYDIVSGQVENGKYAMEVLEGNEND